MIHIIINKKNNLGRDDMRKIILVFFISVLFFCGVVLADDEDEQLIDNSRLWDEIKEVSVDASKTPVLNSRSAVVIDRNSKTVIFGKNENEKRAMASTTKIMTAIILLENGDLSRYSRSITEKQRELVDLD